MVGARLRGVCAATAITGALAAGALLCAAPASALTYADSTSPVNNGFHHGEAIRCPDDKHVVGGGIYVTATYDEINISSAGPDDSINPDEPDAQPDDQWETEIDSFGGETEIKTLIAVCAAKEPKYRRNDIDIDGATHVARCRGETYPIGGGVLTDGTYADRTVVAGSFPYDGRDRGKRPEAWAGRPVAKTFSALGRDASVFAICSKRKPSYRKAPGSIGPMSADGDEARCEPDEQVAGGGFRGPNAPIGPFGPPALYPSSMYPTDASSDGDSEPDDGFAVIADNTDDVENPITVWAICV